MATKAAAAALASAFALSPAGAGELRLRLPALTPAAAASAPLAPATAPGPTAAWASLAPASGPSPDPAPAPLPPSAAAAPAGPSSIASGPVPEPAAGRREPPPPEAAAGDAELGAQAAGARFDGAGGFEGLRRIRFDAPADAPPRAVARARAYLDTLKDQPRLAAAPESAAVDRLRPLFHARHRQVAALDPADPDFLVIKAFGRLPRFGAHRYVDLTNGSRFSTYDARGRRRHFVAVRALREGYSMRVDLRTRAPSTERYVSDELLFEVEYDARGRARRRRFVGPLVLSTSDDILVRNGGFVFEDGRVYSPAPGTLALSGTVIDGLLPDGRGLKYRAALVELEVDPVTGVPSVRRDAAGRPAWHHLTPEGYDFKNVMVVPVEGGAVVALYRLNAPSADGRLPKGYSLLRRRFPSYEALLRYDASRLIADAQKGEVQVLLTAQELRDPHSADPRVLKTGFGPGAKPARLHMDGDGNVFMQEQAGAPRVRLGRIGPEELPGFPLRPGDVKWLFLGHQLRYYEDQGTWRDYNAAAWLTDLDVSRVERARVGLMSADPALDSGQSSMIVDLARHNYPMGAEVIDGKYYFSYGASDTHTGTARADVLALLREMTDGSPQSRAGLAYRLPARTGHVRPRRDP